MKPPSATQPLSIFAIASLCNGKLIGEGDQLITGFAQPEAATSEQACYITSTPRADELSDSAAGLCITSSEIFDQIKPPKSMALLLVVNPRLAFAQAMQALFPAQKCHAGVSPLASISEDAILEEGVTIDAGVVIGPHVRIGAGSHIHAGAKLTSNVTLGCECEIAANAVLRSCELGDNVRIGIGSCIGSDGFGLVPTPEGPIDIPHVGGIIIKSDVRIGAHNIVQTGTFEPTVIGKHVRLGDQNLISHNCKIGDFSILTGMIGLAGSVTIGKGVLMGPRASANIGVKIGDGAQIAPSSAVQKDVAAGEKMFGTPAQPAHEAYRQLAALKRLAKPPKS